MGRVGDGLSRWHLLLVQVLLDLTLFNVQGKLLHRYLKASRNIQTIYDCIWTSCLLSCSSWRANSY
jgi:hypothetical protein